MYPAKLLASFVPALNTLGSTSNFNVRRRHASSSPSIFPLSCIIHSFFNYTSVNICAAQLLYPGIGSLFRARLRAAWQWRQRAPLWALSLVGLQPIKICENSYALLQELILLFCLHRLFCFGIVVFFVLYWIVQPFAAKSVIYKHHQFTLLFPLIIFLSKWRRKPYQKKSYEG